MSLILVKNFLYAVENRELKIAQNYLSPSCTMIFPGGKVIHSLDELVEWSKERYSFVKKEFEKFDIFDGEDEQIIYSIGMLNGRDNNKKIIKDVRYIDRFTIREGKIINIQVWNDLAEGIYNR